jgi:L-lactate dehydrogenase (cytochrome)/(S)-mandelate dehydrogenase
MVSNHGGRQLDSAPGSIDMLPAIADAVAGRMELLIDSGIRRGSDIGKVLCLGAKAAFFGRPAMFGVAAAGDAGASAVIDIMRQEVGLLMGQMGWTDVAKAGPDSLIDLLDPRAGRN